MYSSLPHNGYKKTRLGELFRLEYGRSLPVKNRKNGPYPVVGSAGIIGYHDEAYAKSPCIVVGRKGSIGNVIWLDMESFPIDTTYYVETDNDSVDYQWLFYFLSYLNLARLNRATGVPGLNRDDVYSLIKTVPSLGDQRIIAEVLADIDRTINLTEIVMTKTEQLRDALLHELFSWSFFNHPRNRNLPSLKHTKPTTWQAVFLEDVAEVKKGTSFTSKGLISGDVPVIAGGKQPAYYHKYSNRQGETITVSASGAYAGFVAYHSDPIFATDCTTIRSNVDNLLTKYIYYYLKSEQGKIYRLRNGSAQPHIYPRDLTRFPTLVPSLKDQEYIVALLDSIENSIRSKGVYLNKIRAVHRALMDDMLCESSPTHTGRDH